MVQIKDKNKIWINFIPTCYLRQFFNAEKIYANLANWSVGTRSQTITTPLLGQIHKKNNLRCFAAKSVVLLQLYLPVLLQTILL